MRATSSLHPHRDASDGMLSLLSLALTLALFVVAFYFRVEL